MGNNSPYLLKNVLVNEVIKEGPQIRTSVETGIRGLVFKDILFQPSSFLHMKFWKKASTKYVLDSDKVFHSCTEERLP